MGLSAHQLRYLAVGQLAVPAAINFVLNGAIAFLLFRHVDPVPTWGLQSSAGPDLIGTCFFLPAITCLVVTPLVRRHVRSGLVEPASNSDVPGWLDSLRRPLAVRALLFGLAGLASVGSLIAAALLWTGTAQVGLTPFLWLKASFAAIFGGVVTPLIAVVALSDGERLGMSGVQP
jgi:hypothetical protein